MVQNKLNSKDIIFRKRVVSYADKHGSEKAASKFALSKGQIAAYKAHYSKGTYHGNIYCF